MLGWTGPLAGETVLPSPFQRTTVAFPDDAFRAGSAVPGDAGWIKFTIFVSDPTTVYFHDGNQYPFHYDFATDLVAEYGGMDRSAFDAITLHAQGQRAILGAIVLPYWTVWQPPAQNVREYGIQFIRRDAYPPEQIVSLFDAVKASVSAAGGVEVFYFPTYEQIAAAETHRDYFASQGIPVSSPARWATGNVCYARGWALGELTYVEGDEIADAYRDGRLGPEDILLTDGVPAEIPPVAGIISLSPSTPNSHVAILAGTFSIPFAHLALAEDAARAQSLVGRHVVLRAYGPANNCDVRIIDVEDQLNPRQIAEILALKALEPLNLTPITPYDAYGASTDELLPSDIRYFGGKAANFGMLRRAIPARSPVAAALSFDLWSAFMDQPIAEGVTLRDVIRARLAPHAYPPDVAALAADLAAVRAIIKDDDVTHLAPELRDGVVALLTDPAYSFDRDRKIRFRSSTNVEDSAQFTGAGLYDSYSGCLADDLDGDDAGPSLCDPTKPKERGVFRAIRKVFAGFYNDNAYLERLRHGVNEDDVGMAILVHHSFPDEIELANGVATLDKTRSYLTVIHLVTQDGAVSVANPTDGSIPEEVEVSIYRFGTFLTLNRYSNLLPLGATVLAWEDDYRGLTDLLTTAAAEFERVTGKTSYVLDFEYKKVAPTNALVVKQIREIPQPDDTPSITPFLVNEPAVYCTLQEETNERFANHRAKARWAIETQNTWLGEAQLGQSIYGESTFEFAADGSIQSLSGVVSQWAGASHTFKGTTTTDVWRVDDLENPRGYEVVTANVGKLVSRAECPVLTIGDLGAGGEFGSGCLEVNVTYDQPVPSFDWRGRGTTTEDRTILCPCFAPEPGELLQERQFEGPDQTRITTRFYWPVAPGGIAAGYTAPLARWVETVIEGFTSRPIVLHNGFAQTYLPGHHNFGEHFLFEPRLEPDLDPAIKDELWADNIRLIQVSSVGVEPEFVIHGFLVPPDFDLDGDVDGHDFDHFEACITGPTVEQNNATCLDADFDHDRDIDQTDYSLFQRCLSGEGRSSHPDCAE